MGTREVGAHIYIVFGLPNPPEPPIACLTQPVPVYESSLSQYMRAARFQYKSTLPFSKFFGSKYWRLLPVPSTKPQRTFHSQHMNTNSLKICALGSGLDQTCKMYFSDLYLNFYELYFSDIVMRNSCFELQTVLM